MATGSGLIGITSLVLVEDPWAGFLPRHDSTQAIQAFRQSLTPNTALNGILPSNSTVFAGTLFGLGSGGTSLAPYGQVTLVENPNWDRQPDRNNVLLSIRASQSPVIIQTVEGYVPQPMGLGTQPLGSALFTIPPVSNNVPSTTGPLSGILVSESKFYGFLATRPVTVGYIPAPGPGFNSPFNLNQFVPVVGDTSVPSANVTPIGGALASTSAFYGVLLGAGALGGIWPSSVTFYANLSSLAQGSMSGLFVSSGTLYGGLDGIGNLAGVSISSSLFQVQSLTQFIPLVPFTAVTDVRLNQGYQPWKVHPDDVIG